MSEAEWLACEGNPWVMLDQLGATTERKRRLVLVACGRDFAHQTKNAGVPLALDAAERYADGLLSASALTSCRQQIGSFSLDGTGYQVGVLPMPEQRAINLCILAATAADSAGWPPVPQSLHLGVASGDFPARLTSGLPTILRDIFGNPFRPVSFSPLWRTDTAVSLARQMYESRDFGAMPILADALQDAGCDNDDILDHCRGPLPSRPLSLAEPGERDEKSPHVRGCWVVDLVLGKV